MARKGPGPVEEAKQPTVVTMGGQAFVQLDEPETVAEMTAAEARELATLSALITRLTDDAQHAQRILNVATNQRMSFLRAVIGGKSLPLSDLYNINDETGAIVRTHTLITPPDLSVLPGPDGG
jgi:hypothetical protein